MSQEHTTSIPRVINLTEAKLQSYWDNLVSPSLRLNLGEHEFKYGHPIVISPEDAHMFVLGASHLWETTRAAIEESGGVTSWLEGHEPRIGRYPLNNEKINVQLEERLKAGFLPPIAYDMILAVEEGRPQWKVVEAQSLIAYSVWHRSYLSAAGFDPDSPLAWYGKENPYNFLIEIKSIFAGGEDVTVIDANPFGGSIHDQVGLAKILGGQDSHPVLVSDVEKDHGGYFYYKYAMNQSTGYPLMKEGKPIKTDEKVRIRHVLSRLTQLDLDSLDEEDHAFLNDPGINWIWHPSWQHIVDKHTLARAYHDYRTAHDEYLRYYVPIYSEGQTAPPDWYVQKPVGSVRGEGQTIVHVSNGGRRVPERHVMQKLFTTYPVPVELPQSLKDAFPIPLSIPDNLRGNLSRDFGWFGNTRPGILEVSFMAPPYGQDSHSGYFMARLAPRWSDPLKGRAVTKTNIAPLQEAVWRSTAVDETNVRRLPFGWCPVVISDTLLSYG